MHTLIIEGTFRPGKKTEFVTAWNNEILPTLKKQQGFVDEILLFGTEKPDLGVGLSFWKTRDEAERYHREVFPKVAGSVGHLMNGAPTVRFSAGTRRKGTRYGGPFWRSAESSANL